MKKLIKLNETAGFTRFIKNVANKDLENLQFEYDGINQTCIYFANDFILDLIYDPCWPIKSSNLDTFINFTYVSKFCQDARGALMTLWIAYEINRSNFGQLGQPKWILADRILQIMNAEYEYDFIPCELRIEKIPASIEYFKWVSGYSTSKYPDTHLSKELYNKNNYFQYPAAKEGEVIEEGGIEIIAPSLKNNNIDIPVFDLYFSSKSGLEIEYWTKYHKILKTKKQLYDLLPQGHKDFGPIHKDIVHIFPEINKKNQIKFNLYTINHTYKTISKSKMLFLLKEMKYNQKKIQKISDILGYKSIPNHNKNKRKQISPSLRFKILKRDNYRCQICGRNAKDDNVKLQIDHKIPHSKGGTNEKSNLWTTCFDCNIGKSDKDL